MIVRNPSFSSSHGNTLTSFSMFLGLGFGKPMMSLKKASESLLDLEIVFGLHRSRLRRIRFFSSTEKRLPMSASSK